MSILDQVITGESFWPRRVWIYGPPGVGKSTWAAQAPNPIVMQFAGEDGYGHIGCDRLPPCGTYADAIAQLEELYTGDHPYHTAIIDTLTAFEPLVVKKTLEVRTITDISKPGFGMGYVWVGDQWRCVLGALNGLIERGMMVILVSHDKTVKSKDPRSDEHPVSAPRLMGQGIDAISGWVDDLLFMTSTTATKQLADGTKKIARGVGGGERKIYTSTTPTHQAKSRAPYPGMKAEIGTNWDDYAKHFTGETDNGS